jgi:uncharacterized protein
MPTKSLPFEFAANSDKMTFEGYASTYKRDLVGDQITQGAFSKTIQERFPRNQIKILWQHSEPIGLPIRLEEDSKGLYIQGRLSDTQTARDAWSLMKDRVVDSMSIGYDVIKDSLSDDGSTRFLHELKLYEFSPVTFPANPDTSITDVKNIDYDIMQMRMLIKAGRVLSAANMDRLRNIMTELSDLLSSAEPSDVTPPKAEPIDDTQYTDSMKSLRSLITEMTNYRKG